MAKLDALLFRERGIHITTLRHPHGFEWLMFDEPKQKPSSLEKRARRGKTSPQLRVAAAQFPKVIDSL